MTAPATPPPPIPPVPAVASAPAAARRDGTWSITWHGLRTVAQLELRQRVRSTRWIVSLVVFGVIVGGVTALTWSASNAAMAGMPTGDPYAGRIMFGFIVFFVLFLGLLVSPTLSATAINGDRAAGTLATLQVTLLSPAEIVLGKLVAAWVASLAFLAVSVPFIIWAFAAGGTPPLALLTTLLLLAAMLAVVCAIGLGWSAITARTAGSAVLTYVSVAGLTVLSLIVFALSLTLVSGRDTVTIYGQDWRNGAPSEKCEVYQVERYVAHTERTWWLLAVNPFVIVADAMPVDADSEYLFGDPMSGIKAGIRAAREGTPDQLDECYVNGWESQSITSPDDQSPVWPWGLAADLLLGAGGVVVAVRRLRIPQRTLPKGTRVA